MTDMRLCTVDRRHPARARQRGVTLFGLLFWAIVVGFVAYVVLRVFPTVNEYLTIKRTIEKVAARRPPPWPRRAPPSSGRRTSNTPSARSGKDLEVTKEEREGRDQPSPTTRRSPLRPGVPADQVRRAFVGSR
jgi:hypothetical protein